MNFQKLETIEKKVSKYIRSNFSFAVIEVNDKNERLDLESKIISTVSLCTECEPSEKWLGVHSSKEKIVESGLWLIQGLWKVPLSSNDILKIENLSQG
jgi:hypothetical protein